MPGPHSSHVPQPIAMTINLTLPQPARICLAIPFVLTSVPSLNVSPLRQHADTLPFHQSTLQHLHELTRPPTPRGIHALLSNHQRQPQLFAGTTRSTICDVSCLVSSRLQALQGRADDRPTAPGTGLPSNTRLLWDAGGGWVAEGTHARKDRIPGEREDVKPKGYLGGCNHFVTAGSPEGKAAFLNKLDVLWGSGAGSGPQ